MSSTLPVIARPNLFIIGAMKSGTTTLHEYLDCHPQIAMSRIKEPGYFVEELTQRRGEDWYLSLFEQDGCFRYRGESSTHYTKLPVYRGVAERLHQFNPDAHLIYIMRNPIERLVSHYWHNVRDPLYGRERHSLLKAVRKRPDYLAFGDYAMQLEPYIDLFGRDALYVLTFENLIQNPQGELERLYDWLGLPSHPLGDESLKAHNQKPKDIIGVAGAGVLNRIEHSNAWDGISPYVPKWVKDWARRRAYRPIDERLPQKDIPRLQEAIGDLQRRQIEKLSRLLGREFPEWRIAGEYPAEYAAASQREWRG
jgi:hypothetical protein